MVRDLAFEVPTEPFLAKAAADRAAAAAAAAARNNQGFLSLLSRSLANLFFTILGRANLPQESCVNLTLVSGERCTKPFREGSYRRE